MITVLSNWSSSVNWLWFILPPIGIWLTGAVSLVGFVPLLDLNNLSKDRDWKKVLQLGLKRAFRYRSELIFTAVSLGLFTDLFSILLTLRAKLLPVFPEVVAAPLGYLILFLIFMAKISTIAQQAPSGSLVQSISYLYGGISNPFSEYETYNVSG